MGLELLSPCDVQNAFEVFQNSEVMDTRPVPLAGVHGYGYQTTILSRANVGYG